MKNSRKLKLGASLVCLATLTACAGTLVQIGPKSGTPPVTGTERSISSKGCGFQLLLLIPIAINDRQERAYNQLLAQAGGDYVTDVQVEEEWTYAFVGTMYCTKMRANAVHAIPKPPSSPPTPAQESLPLVPAIESNPSLPPAVAPPIPPAASPASARVVGQTAKLRSGANVHARPMAASDAVKSVDPAVPLTLKVSMRNGEGLWWYVSTGSSTGWVLESDLEPGTP